MSLRSNRSVRGDDTGAGPGPAVRFVPVVGEEGWDEAPSRAMRKTETYDGDRAAIEAVALAAETFPAIVAAPVDALLARTGELTRKLSRPQFKSFDRMSFSTRSSAAGVRPKPMPPSTSSVSPFQSATANSW